jgi:hypothetical protein
MLLQPRNCKFTPSLDKIKDFVIHGYVIQILHGDGKPLTEWQKAVVRIRQSSDYKAPNGYFEANSRSVSQEILYRRCSQIFRYPHSQERAAYYHQPIS